MTEVTDRAMTRIYIYIKRNEKKEIFLAKHT
jgi:hypothetical protein